MNLDILRTLLAIAEYGSFAAAARARNLSQSAVSTHITAIESDLGRELFDRTKRPPVLNDVGVTMVSRAKDLLAHYDDMRNSIASTGAVAGRLQLGAVGSTLTGLLPLALTAIRAHHPGMHIEVVSGFSEQLLHLVERRRIDAAIVSDYDGSSRDINWRPFLRERLVMIAPSHTQETDISCLTSMYPFIRYSPTAAVGRLIDRAIHHAGLNLRETMRLDWLEGIEAMVHHGHGIAIIPERRVPVHSDWRVRTLNFGTTSFHRTLGLIEPQDDQKRKLVNTLHSELQTLVRQ